MTKYQTLGNLTEMYFRTVLESRSLNTECQQDLCSLHGPDGLMPCRFLARIVPASLEVLRLQPYHSKALFLLYGVPFASVHIIFPLCLSVSVSSLFIRTPVLLSLP